MSIYYTKDNFIDRICVLDCQLVAYPNLLLFGQCHQLNNFNSVMPEDNSFSIYNSELEYFLTVLLNYSDMSLKNDSADTKSFEFQHSHSKILITTDPESYLIIFVAPNGFEYSFKNDEHFKLVLNGVIDLALLTYNYSGIVNHYLSKFLNITNFEDLNTLTEEKTFLILSEINPPLDYYMFFRVIYRHQKVLCIMKKLQSV